MGKKSSKTSCTICLRICYCPKAVFLREHFTPCSTKKYTRHIILHARGNTHVDVCLEMQPLTDWAEHLPIVTSEELWASKNLFKCCQTLGIQSIILTSSAFLILLLISVSINFLLRKRPRKPLTGSVWLAHSTHLWQSRKNVHHYSLVLQNKTILGDIFHIVSGLLSWSK